MKPKPTEFKEGRKGKGIEREKGLGQRQGNLDAFVHTIARPKPRSDQPITSTKGKRRATSSSLSEDRSASPPIRRKLMHSLIIISSDEEDGEAIATPASKRRKVTPLSTSSKAGTSRDQSTTRSLSTPRSSVAPPHSILSSPVIPEEEELSHNYSHDTGSNTIKERDENPFAVAPRGTPMGLVIPPPFFPPVGQVIVPPPFFPPVEDVPPSPSPVSVETETQVVPSSQTQSLLWLAPPGRSSPISPNRKISRNLTLRAVTPKKESSSGSVVASSQTPEALRIMDVPAFDRVFPPPKAKRAASRSHNATFAIPPPVTPGNRASKRSAISHSPEKLRLLRTPHFSSPPKAWSPDRTQTYHSPSRSSPLRSWNNGDLEDPDITLVENAPSSSHVKAHLEPGSPSSLSHAFDAGPATQATSISTQTLTQESVTESPSAQHVRFSPFEDEDDLNGLERRGSQRRKEYRLAAESLYEEESFGQSGDVTLLSPTRRVRGLEDSDEGYLPRGPPDAGRAGEKYQAAASSIPTQTVTNGSTSQNPPRSSPPPSGGSDQSSSYFEQSMPSQIKYFLSESYEANLSKYILPETQSSSSS